MNIILLDSSDWAQVRTNGLGRDEIKTHITHATEEVAKLIELPEHLNVIIRPHNWLNIIPETGDGGQTIDTELVSVTFDPNVPYGKALLLKSLRESVFHELNHVYRWMTSDFDEHILNSAVFEGLATVFETDYAGAAPPWSQYEDEPVEDWLHELATKTNADYNDYFFVHPDGRKWIGYKVGTWLVREATKNSGKNVIELSRTSWREIINIADKNDLIGEKE